MEKAHKSQMKTNDVNTQTLHASIDNISKMNNVNMVDKSFKRMTTKLLLEQKHTNVPAIPESRTQESLPTWFESITRLLRTSPWDMDGTSLLEMHLPPELSEASEAYRI